ncbi:recombinase family protein [Chryseobacterium sp. M5]|uniref:recombinase family protein n=1 Tax=Chryseobacterium sp. M5 TaxID=3379128 RepID=UPI003857E688
MDLQIEALEKAGNEKIYQEKISSATKNRPELDKCLNILKEVMNCMFGNWID